MEETRKRQDHETAVESAMKRPRTPATPECTGELGEDIMAWLSVDVDTMDELLKLLDTDQSSSSTTTSSTNVRVKFIDNPYSSSVIFQSSSSYVTINGNEESCGSSFSDSESSVMASIDMGGVINNGLAEDECGAWDSNKMEARDVINQSGSKFWDEEMEWFDWDDEDDVLARFLGEELLEEQHQKT